ncbi:MAG: signal peptidase I [Candidatus Gracilibacteria bacterium]|nr:signal peptidase I [Candidatus Gracilibacteria bacterium]
MEIQEQEKNKQEQEKIISKLQKKNSLSEIIDFIKDLVVIIIVVLIIRSFIVLPFQISGHSMDESYYDKQFIIVDRFSYITGLTNPKRGDVIVFNTHITNKEYFIKRIIGLPGETIKIENGIVSVKNKDTQEFTNLDEKYLSDLNYNSTYINGDDSLYIYNIPEGEYFVMGDNRGASSDSRTCFSSCNYGNKTNYILEKDIVGKVFIDLGYFNFKTFSFYNPILEKNTIPTLFSSPSSYKYE